MINAVITGSGHFMPPNVIKNDSFGKHEFFDEAGNRINKSNEEIIAKFQEITEIEERRYVDESMCNSEMASIAAERALKDAKVDKEDLDYIILAHNYGDITMDQRVDIMPSLSARIKHLLGIKNNKCKPYDMNFGCPGWIEGMILGSQLIKANIANKILIIGSETLSRAIDPYDRSAMIFADGAGAVVLEAKEDDEEYGIIAHITQSDTLYEHEYLNNAKSLNPDNVENPVSISMKGRKVYEYALKNVPPALKQLVDDTGIDVNEIDKILLHQANAKMDHAMITRFYKLYDIQQPPKDVDPMTVQKLGNSSVATVPTMFDLIIKKELDDYSFKPDSFILMGSVGAGMSINAILYKFPKN